MRKHSGGQTAACGGHLLARNSERLFVACSPMGTGFPLKFRGSLAATPPSVNGREHTTSRASDQLGSSADQTLGRRGRRTSAARKPRLDFPKEAVDPRVCRYGCGETTKGTWASGPRQQGPWPRGAEEWVGSTAASAIGRSRTTLLAEEPARRRRADPVCPHSPAPASAGARGSRAAVGRLRRRCGAPLRRVAGPAGDRERATGFGPGRAPVPRLSPGWRGPPRQLPVGRGRARQAHPPQQRRRPAPADVPRSTPRSAGRRRGSRTDEYGAAWRCRSVGVRVRRWGRAGPASRAMVCAFDWARAQRARSAASCSCPGGRSWSCSVLAPVTRYSRVSTFARLTAT
jgi:hypothetical protein